MKNLRQKFERFCFKHRNKGIPNLMLFLCIGSAIVYVLSQMNPEASLYNILCFNRDRILEGQVWRLFTYIFTYNRGNLLMLIIGLVCYFSLGRAMENIWGALRFNLFYFSGVLLMDIFAMCFGGSADVYYLNLSLLLAYATMYPDAQFLLFFFIPVKAWLLAMVYLLLTVWDVIVYTAAGLIPHNLFPLIAIGNYLLFFGKDVLNVVPTSWQVNLRRLFRKKDRKKATGTIPFSGSYQAATATVKQPYTHRCTVCGKTDVSHPDLEFRYCSRCKGYFCYCQDHISNHNHIE